jgi:hypothetical protein
MLSMIECNNSALILYINISDKIDLCTIRM